MSLQNGVVLKLCSTFVKYTRASLVEMNEKLCFVHWSPAFLRCGGVWRCLSSELLTGFWLESPKERLGPLRGGGEAFLH